MIHQLFNDAIIYALSWTILHSLWQVGLIALSLKILFSFVPSWTANAKYNISLGALLLTGAAAIGTFLFYYTPEIALEPGMATSFVGDLTSVTITREYSPTLEVVHFFDRHLILISNLWLVGTVLFLLKFIIGLGFVRSIYNGALPIDNNTVQNIFAKTKERMSLKKDVLLGISQSISTPMVIGVIKPMVLFPIGIINQLTPEEIESIFAHELAHIKRNDFIINLIQSLIETIFYFNPGVWYISRVIRRERENCCDDIALLNCNSYVYAKVLIKLAELKQSQMPKLAMTLSRDKKSLQTRIKRILKVPSHHSYIKERAFSLLFVLALFLAFTNTTETRIETTPEALDRLSINEVLPVENTRQIAISDTIPKKSQTTAVLVDDDKEVEVHVEGGDIVSFKLNGKAIDPDDLKKEDNTYFYKGEKMIKIGPNGGVMIGDLENKKFGSFQFDTDVNVRMDSLLGNHFILENEDGVVKWKMDMFPEGTRSFHFDSDNFDFENYQLDLKMNLDSLISNNFLLEKDGKIIRWNSENLPEQLKEMEFFSKDGLDWDGIFDSNGNLFYHNDELIENIEELREMEIEIEDILPRGNNFHFQNRNNMSLSDKLARELNRDGLLLIRENNKIELSGKHLKINGDKQPANIFSKYKGLYEEYVGAVLTKNSKIELDIIGKKTKRQL